jgi:hypothetical protein
VDAVRIEDKSHLTYLWPQSCEHGDCFGEHDELRQKIGPDDSVQGLPRIGFEPAIHAAMSIDPVFQMRGTEGDEVPS